MASRQRDRGGLRPIRVLVDVPDRGVVHVVAQRERLLQVDRAQSQQDGHLRPAAGLPATLDVVVGSATRFGSTPASLYR